MKAQGKITNDEYGTELRVTVSVDKMAGVLFDESDLYNVVNAALIQLVKLISNESEE
jgi:hypothetical protein